MYAIQNFFNNIFQMIPDIIWAAIFLGLAFLAATLVKSLVLKLLKAVKLEALLTKMGVEERVIKAAFTFIGKLVYFVTFLLFIPSVLDKLNMHIVASPISSMANTFLAFVPKLVSAVIIVVIGLFVANIVKDLLIPVLKALKVDAIQEKAGIAATENTSFSSIIANVVYGVIVLVVVTSALDKLEIKAISNPANAVVAAVFAVIPKMFAAIIIIAAGMFIAKLVAKLLESLLAGVGADNLIEKITGNASKKVSVSKFVSGVVKYVLVIIFLVQGINVLDLPVLTNIGVAIIEYLPAVITAIIILAVGMFAANTAEAALVKKFPEAKIGALVAKIAIYVFIGFICLNQLGVAIEIVEETFILVVTAFCAAFAIAFGFGGRNAAADILAKLQQKMENNKEE